MELTEALAQIYWVRKAVLGLLDLVVQRRMVAQAAMVLDGRSLPLLHLSCLFVEAQEPFLEVFVVEQALEQVG